MQYSVVNYKTVEENDIFRLDADFYRTDYLKYLQQINSKKTFLLKKILHPTEIKRVYEDNGIQILLAQNVRNNKLDFSSIVFMSEKTKNELRRNKLQYDDVVLTRSGANFGQVASYKKKQDIYACADVLIIKKHHDLKGGYLSTFLNTKQGRALIDRGSYGMAQPHIAPSYLYKLPIPRFNENFEGIIDNLINKSQLYIDKSHHLYSQAEQLLLSELGLLDWKPKHQLVFVKNYSDTQKAERIDAEYFQPMYNEVVNAIKSSKNYTCLGNIVSIKKCIEPGSGAYQDTGIPFLRVSNLSKFGINNDNQQFISDALYDTLKSHQPKKGEILLSKDATPGIAYYLKDVPCKMIPSGGILRITVKETDRILPEYLTLVLNSVIVQKQIERDAGGSIINHWLVEQVRNTLIPILPLQVQKELAEKIDQSFSDREQSKRLLDIAKRGVEMAIEEDETTAEKWIKAELKKLEIEL